MAERYKVVEDFERTECDAYVVDTTRATHGNPATTRTEALQAFFVMCECAEREEAETIAEALNKYAQDWKK